jgi:predicted AAA+ superfamily ATPase
MFRTRDESFQLIERLWKITMARLLKWAEVENQTDQSYDSLKNFVVTSMADEDVLTKSRGILASSHVRFLKVVSKLPVDTCHFRVRTRSCR